VGDPVLSGTEAEAMSIIGDEPRGVDPYFWGKGGKGAFFASDGQPILGFCLARGRCFTKTPA